MGDVAYVQLSGTPSTVTLGIYEGIAPQELQHLMRVALNYEDNVCVGFQVPPLTEKKKRQSNSIPHLIPLSVACKVPKLLVGQVSALIAPALAPTYPQGIKTEVPKAAIDLQRLHKLLDALISEEKLSIFECAILKDMCEQQNANVLASMAGSASVDKKKSFLLRLLHPENFQGPIIRLPLAMQSDHQDPLRDELVAKRIAAIGRRVYSSHVQMQVLALSRETWKTLNLMHYSDTMELLIMIETLLDKHELGDELVAPALKLILDQNEVLWRALQHYQSNRNNLIHLEMTVKQLAEQATDQYKQESSNEQPNLSRMGVSIVTSFHAQHMLTSLELDLLLALLAQDDSQVLQCIYDYKTRTQESAVMLRDSLVAIVDELTLEVGDDEKAAAAFGHGMDDAVREEDNGPLDGCHDDERDWLGWQRHLTFLLRQWQRQAELSPIAATTLHKMVAQRHNLLESAYEVFARDADATELLDTLQRVAKLQRQMEQQGARNECPPITTKHLSLENVVRQMQRSGTLEDEDAAGLLELFHGGNEALQAANEAFQADRDVRELEETLLLVVKHARFGKDTVGDAETDEFQVKARLLRTLGQTGRLDIWQVQLLVSLLKSRDSRVLAAVDVYDEENEIEDFVETLEILAELAAWECHGHAIVQDWIAPLARSNKLPRGGAERLVQLVKSRDDRVVAALVVFLSDNNQDDFVDTLVRIACLEAMKLKGMQSDEAREGHVALAMLQELTDYRVVSREERAQVKALVCAGEARMLAALDVLAATHDAEDFADTARRILALLEVKAVLKDDAAQQLLDISGKDPTTGRCSIEREHKKSLDETRKKGKEICLCEVTDVTMDLAETIKIDAFEKKQENQAEEGAKGDN
ncbi:hypothetical protein CCR75_005593 [Bremia lactucae]|uniref:Uncharacterized protein n=1 Tax=Bremia lactucae TaxID=4779 RepID=A0A976ILJ1_BRELC|nr:hypothetical protein CCR75_005593 [Bremia lactucae]